MKQKSDEDKSTHLRTLVTKYHHYWWALILFGSGLMMLIFNQSITHYLNTSILIGFGIINTSIIIGIGTSFITAGIVDVLYNIKLIKDTNILIAKHLMLTKDVQNEILKNDKQQQILECALENKLGDDLKHPILILINKLNGFKNSGILGVELKTIEEGSGSKALTRDFYNCIVTEECKEKLYSNKILVIATDNDKIYNEECEKNDTADNYIFLLPSNLKPIKNEFKFEPQLIVNNKIISPKNEIDSSIGDNRLLKYEYEIGIDISKEANVKLIINTYLSKIEHIFFWDLPKAFNDYYIDINYKDTDIEKCDHFLPFLVPEERCRTFERRLTIRLNELILPPCTMCFVWYCKGEIPTE